MSFDSGVSTEQWSGPVSLSCQRAPSDTKKMKYIALQIYIALEIFGRHSKTLHLCVCMRASVLVYQSVVSLPHSLTRIKAF